MKTNTHASRNRSKLLLLVVFCFAFVVEAQAQVSSRADVTEGPRRIAEHLAEADVVVDPVADLASMTEVSKAWMKQVERQYTQALRSPDASTQEEALKDIIHIAVFYGDKVTFKKVISPLLRTYRHARDENHRIMALSALSEIGDWYAMDQLRESVQFERSERVRRYTLLALRSYARSQRKAK